MADVGPVLEKQREFFASGATRGAEFRLQALWRLNEAVTRGEHELSEALRQDLGKSEFEAYATEIGMILGEIKFARRQLKRWMRPQRVRTPLLHFPASCRIYHDPYGVALIMSPWNYPVQLTLAPLIGAIAGGNCAVVKPSAYSPAVSAALAKMIGECFEPQFVAVVEGGREENKALLGEKFDYIFFTGSVAVGKTVMEAASRNLTPVTLELGGKSPCIVCADADIKLAARRIVWGKFLNAGQTCVAPDYLLVQRPVRERLIESIRETVREFFGEEPLLSPDLPKIISEKHFGRLTAYLSCGNVAAGGKTDAAARKIEPTVLTDTGWDSPVMNEEIFGPVLPVIEFDEIGEVISWVTSRPKPLALYLFTNDPKTRKLILGRVSFGGGCVNDTIVHLASSYMPFGGVGESGMGGYHGKGSFSTFTHEKSVLSKSNRLDIKLRYPPYKGKLNLVRRLMGGG